MNRKFLLVGVSVLGLLACAQKGPSYPNPDPLPPPNLLQGVAMTAPVTVRVIVQFKQAVASNDDALVKTLQAQAQAPVHYLTAVSGDTHVYGVQLPADQAPTAALQRLSTLPSVARVELDDKAH
jgi:hypothetical protein